MCKNCEKRSKNKELSGKGFCSVLSKYSYKCEGDMIYGI